VTTSEHDDFGQLTLDRSPTRGDLRYEYDGRSAMTKRQRSSYNSTANSEATTYSRDGLARETQRSYGSSAWNFKYDGIGQPSGSCPNVSASNQLGHLSSYGANALTLKVLCYHPNGQLYAAFQNYTTTWDNNTNTEGTTMIYDLNGNVQEKIVFDRPATRAYARSIQYVYDSSLMDRVSYVEHKLTSSTSWTLITSNTSLPQYFAMGGIKQITYANGITESNTRDLAGRLATRKTSDGTTNFTYLQLAYDANGNITTYDDSAGLRHLKTYAQTDHLNRLRCLSRNSISSCTNTGSAPWENSYNESFSYDASGNRTDRRYGQFTTADEDTYTYVSGTDIISKVTSGGTDENQSHTFRGEISAVNQPVNIAYNWGVEDQAYQTNDNFLGNVGHYYSPFNDRYEKIAVCNHYVSLYTMTPSGPGGTSSELSTMDLPYGCSSNTPRQYRTYVYLEGRPLAAIHSHQHNSFNQGDDGTYWIHTDQLGSPILVTQSDRTERWRWENDPFGRADPVEYTVSPSTLSPADTSNDGGASYNTCCCDDAGANCGSASASCSSAGCAGGTSQAIVWSKTYTVTGANNIRLHFSAFDVHAGSSRTAADYVQLQAGSTVIGNYTGTLGAFWTPWAGVGNNAMTASLVSDNSTQTNAGFTIDKLEYTSASNGQFVMWLRMPGQIWDDDVQTTSNFQRWYRREDGRYLSPDSIGLEGGEPGYSAYANSNPLTAADPRGECYGPGHRPAPCHAMGQGGPIPIRAGFSGIGPIGPGTPIIPGTMSIDTLKAPQLGPAPPGCYQTYATGAFGTCEAVLPTLSGGPAPVAICEAWLDLSNGNTIPADATVTGFTPPGRTSLGAPECFVACMICSATCAAEGGTLVFTGGWKSGWKLECEIAQVASP
jgi:RHS repeat-associated protein